MVLFLLENLPAGPKSQDRPVQAPHATVLPVIDGTGDDACWQNQTWQSIDQVWIPYDGVVTPDDYSGQYKVAWSPTSNLLYFLVEIYDDVFIDGYVYGQGADIYNFDITEVFIDEDTSGGPHIFDDQTHNAENAFSYHIYADFPEDGGVNNEHRVNDMAGFYQSVNYTAHLPEFALRKNGEVATWEFSLIVYNDTYTQNNPEAARVQLQTDKIIGLSVAYCDNDDPDGQRDNMFGSVWEPAPGNLHWQNADGYGRIKLVESIPDYISGTNSSPTEAMKLYPNPTSSFLQLQIQNPYQGNISIHVYNILGQEVFKATDIKSGQLYNKTLFLNRLSAGVYFLQTQVGQSILRQKLIITPRK